MSPFQVALLVQFVVVIAICWMWGGHTERRAAVWVLLFETIEGALIPVVWFRGFLPLNLALDVLLAGLIIHLAMSRRRWWLFAAAGTLLLTLVVDLRQVLGDETDFRAHVSAHVGLAALLLLTMLFGVLERILAGEAPASSDARWRSRKAT